MITRYNITLFRFVSARSIFLYIFFKNCKVKKEILFIFLKEFSAEKKKKKSCTCLML